MPSRTPPLGSQAVHVPASPQVVQVTASTCHNLSVFKDLMKEYRRLDDGVTMRLNRNLAQFRDRARAGAGAAEVSLQDEACGYFWDQLVAGWKARTEIVEYCIDVVDTGLAQRRTALVGEEDAAADAATRRRRRDAVLYAEEVKRTQIHNELAVERIVRLRSFEAFQARCKYFQPPRTDSEARRWWDMALSGR